MKKLFLILALFCSSFAHAADSNLNHQVNELIKLVRANDVKEVTSQLQANAQLAQAEITYQNQTKGNFFSEILLCATTPISGSTALTSEQALAMLKIFLENGLKVTTKMFDSVLQTSADHYELLKLLFYHDQCLDDSFILGRIL